MKYIGVHGIWTDGDGNVDRALWWMRSRYGYATHDVQTPIQNPFTARFRADEDAECVLAIAEPGDAVIAHSYGCCVVAEAMKKIDFGQVFMFRPAMDRRFEFPEGMKTRVHCVHSRGDWALLFGMLLRWHRFGNAGRVGFNDDRVINVPSSGGHNADFDRLEHFGAYMHNHTKNR